jgi:hypothetical protein
MNNGVSIHQASFCVFIRAAQPLQKGYTASNSSVAHTFNFEKNISKDHNIRDTEVMM